MQFNFEKGDPEVLTISDYHQVTNLLLAEAGEFAVSGEVIQLKTSQKGGVFIELKDPDKPAILKVSNFSANMEGWKSISEGMDVVVYGYSEIYAPYGNISFKARKIEPLGQGSLQQAFDKLKELLAAEGLFAEERKRALPRFVTKVALISGYQSAAYADFTKIIREQSPGVEIDFYPVLVQGEKSAEEVIAALGKANKSDAEVIAIVRGGGSLEDLKSFNSEIVARAVYAAEKPILTGVGHEIDVSIADMVADLRASTPSQAAYYIVSRNQELLADLERKNIDFYHKLSEFMPDLGRLQSQLTNLHYKLKLNMPGKQEYELAQHNLYRYSRYLLDNMRQSRSEIEATSRFGYRLANKLELQNRLISKDISILSAYNPDKVIARGYALVKHNGKYISAADNLAPGDKIDIKLSKGQINAEVKELN